MFGQDSDHYRSFIAQVSSYLTFSPAYRAQGVLRAAREDYCGGHLFQVRRLVEAEIFDGFLEQAEYLLDLGYYQAAAVIAGGVLEDGLRKLCERNGIQITAKPKLDTMNADLAKAGMFSTLVQKRITALADLRNKAAHGQWDEFESKDVAEMVAAVRRLMEEHFA